MTSYYTTEAAKVELRCPDQMQGMSGEQIVAYLWQHYKTDDRGCPANKATAYMQAVAQAIFKPGDWKAPIYAILPDFGKEWAKAAIIWYHGAKPLESFVGVYSNGYACN